MRSLSHEPSALAGLSGARRIRRGGQSDDPHGGGREEEDLTQLRSRRRQPAPHRSHPPAARFRAAVRWTLCAAIGALAAWTVTAASARQGPADSALGPRPLTAPERQAVQLAAEYLAGGPAAWWPHLARGSWLRALGREAAIAEIEARAGEPAGARWTLETAPADFAAHGAAFSLEFPSGADDTLLIELVPEAGSFAIESVGVAAEPVPASAAGAAPGAGIASADAASEAGGGGRGATAVRGRLSAAAAALAGQGTLLAALLAATGLAVLAGGRWLARRRRGAPPAPVPGRASFAVAPPEPVRGAQALTAAGLALLALAAVQLALLLRRGELGAAFLVAFRPPAATAAAEAKAPEHLRLRALLPLRLALTAPPRPEPASAAAPSPPGGARPAPVTASMPLDATPTDACQESLVAAAAATVGPAAGRVASLWCAQQRLERGDLTGAERLLRGPAGAAGGSGPRGGAENGAENGPAPLAELLRGRLALLRLQAVETGLAYERALAAGVAHEGMVLEAAEALYILGFEDTAKRYLHRLAELGARGAEAWYSLADLELLDHQEHAARRDFRIAWRLQPTARAELLAQSLSAFMLQDRDLRHMMALGAFAEPRGACEGVSRRALELPPGVAARLLGEVLRLTVREPPGAPPIAGAPATAAVLAPGACDLAPAGTAQVGAATWQEEREAAALARLAALRRAAASGGALAQPVLRRQTEEAAAALAERQRWSELVEITEGLAQPTAILPPRLTRLRAAALAHLGRNGEARDLLVRLALGDKASKRADPAALYQLAELLEQAGEFDQAIRLVAKGDSELPRPPGGDRLLQLQMEKRLAASMERFRSPHFVVSYPLSRGPAFAKEAARVLEAERERLQKWIPQLPGGGGPVEVRLLPFEDFELAYSQGGEVLGLFDGVIRLPLGSLRTFRPFAVAVLSHELAHAMIARRTGDRAPRWFHEGLAQHVEMQEEARVNPIADYRSSDRLLAFPLLEPALASFSSAVWISAAYDEALWTLNYIEARYGVAGIHRLLDAFRAGQTTGEALSSALGTTTERFDSDLWEWCVGRAPRAWQVEVVRYDGGEARPHRF
jgi:tetratricopeptide (TPR) repeat protein